MPKERLDILVHDRGLVESRELAKRLIMAGKVTVNGHVLAKPGNKIDVDSVIVLEEPQKYVSRGGFKLEEALKTFSVSVNGLICADIGASTGGFTDCLLQNGAVKVYAVDVGRGQLHWKLVSDKRVVQIDKFNARNATADLIPEQVDLITMDVSFISLTKVMPSLLSILKPNGSFIVLIKPQFETERENVGKGGVVRDPEVHKQVVEKIRQFAVNDLKLEFAGVCQSPITGPAGNIEFLAYFRRNVQ